MMSQSESAPKANRQFTAVNAREMARRSALARVAKREQAAKQPQPAPLEAGDVESGFVEERLKSVRAVLISLDTRLAKETEKGDAGCIAKLARARASLGETERVLSNRPSPGALRPLPKLPKVAHDAAKDIANLADQHEKIRDAIATIFKTRQPFIDAEDEKRLADAKPVMSRNEPMPPIGPMVELP